MRLSFLSKANESLPITSRLSDGHKSLFLNDIIDQMIGRSLAQADQRILSRIQSAEIIQSMRSHSENIYECVLDSSSLIIKVSENPESIRCAVTIISHVSLCSHNFINITKFFSSLLFWGFLVFIKLAKLLFQLFVNIR